MNISQLRTIKLGELAEALMVDKYILRDKLGLDDLHPSIRLPLERGEINLACGIALLKLPIGDEQKYAEKVKEIKDDFYSTQEFAGEMLRGLRRKSGDARQA